MSSGYKKLPVPAGGGSGLPGGPSGSIQYNDSGSLNGSSNLAWDNANSILSLGGLVYRALSSTVSLVNNQLSPITCITYNAATYNYTIVEYSLIRNGITHVGRLYVANNASNVGMSNDFASITDLGVNFTTIVSGGNVEVQYTTTNTGFNAFFRYTIRQWV